MLLVQLDLRVILTANGSKGIGTHTFSLTRGQGLVLNGKNPSLLLLPALYGTTMLPGNAFSFGAIMKALSPLSTQVTPKLPR